MVNRFFVAFAGSILLASFATAAVSTAVPTSAPTTQAAEDSDVLSPQDEAVQRKLEARLPAELRFNAEPLDNAIHRLQTMADIKFVVDWPALEKANIRRDVPVTAQLRSNTKISWALEMIFKTVEGDDDGHQMGYRISDGNLTITSRELLNRLRVTRDYDIGDFLGNRSDKLPTTVPAGMSAIESDRQARREELEQYISQNVDANSWKDNGGDVGEIQILKDTLKITQTPENQRKVREVLASLSEARKHPLPEVRQAPTGGPGPGK